MQFRRGIDNQYYQIVQRLAAEFDRLVAVLLQRQVVASGIPVRKIQQCHYALCRKHESAQYVC